MPSRLRYASKRSFFLDGELMHCSGLDYSSAAHDRERDAGTTSAAIKTAGLGVQGFERDYAQSEREDGPVSLVTHALRERKRECKRQVFRQTILCGRR